MEPIIAPKLGPEGELLWAKLKSKGWNIVWCIESTLAGQASSNFDEQKISFRSRDLSEDRGVAFHELLHFDLYDKGYPILAPKFGNTFSIFMLNDIFQHIVMSPELEKAGFSIKEQEGKAILKLIRDLVGVRPKLSEDEELFSAVLYMRAFFLKTEEGSMITLEKYIRDKNKRLTLDRIREIIIRFPKPDCELNEYTKCLNNVLFALDIKNEVHFKCN